MKDEKRESAFHPSSFILHPWIECLNFPVYEKLQS